MNPQTEYEIDAAIAEFGFSDEPPVRWYIVGDHGKFAHAFPLGAGGIYHSYCGIGPGWIEVGDKVAHCQKCEKWCRL